MSPPAGRTLRLPNVCPGPKAEWALISSRRTAPCPPSPPAPTTKSRITTTTTSSCSSTPSGPLQTLPPSSPPRGAQLATGHPTTTTTHTTTEPPPPPPPPTTTATTPAACLAGSPSPRGPAPAGALSPDQSATPSCPMLRCCHRPTANLRLPPRHRRCPPPQSPLPTSPAWEGCPSWCLHRTRPGLWCETKHNIFHVHQLGLDEKTVLPTHTHTHIHFVNFLLSHPNIFFFFFKYFIIIPYF